MTKHVGAVIASMREHLPIERHGVVVAATYLFLVIGTIAENGWLTRGRVITGLSMTPPRSRNQLPDCLQRCRALR